ncbi:MAG: vanadium-dependent haloperoxidase [Bacteroidota bacterium]
MKRLIFLWMLLIGSLFFSACEQVNPNFQEAADRPEWIHRSVKKLTDVIVHDIFSPPVASRNYAYPMIAAYEVLRQGSPNYQSLAGQLNGLEVVPQPQADQTYCYPLAAVHAFLTTARHFIFSEDKLMAFQQEIATEFEALKMPKAVYDRSIAYGEQMSQRIIDWSKTDLYAETRTYPRYSISDEPARWAPTPPDYMDAIEPHWNKIRTMVLDSATQFVPEAPTPFDMDKQSQFYKELMEVYTAVKEADEEELAIAQFWDCNPYVSHHKGHVMYATKKITPGGHWIGITQIATRKNKANLMETIEAYTLVAIALFDGFISCWDEKYRSNLIRPETVINQYLDEDWLPILQTPPFPEYTSGHSVISGASAVALTHLFGDSFAFVDSTEVEYGLPPRSFTSFFDASDEAAISRLYGGIHYRPAIEYGVDQGRNVGKFIVGQLELRQ